MRARHQPAPAESKHTRALPVEGREPRGQAGGRAEALQATGCPICRRRRANSEGSCLISLYRWPLEAQVNSRNRSDAPPVRYAHYQPSICLRLIGSPLLLCYSARQPRRPTERDTSSKANNERIPAHIIRASLWPTSDGLQGQLKVHLLGAANCRRRNKFSSAGFKCHH